MEWKTIRRWLILMVLAVDLFLAGNLLRQGLSVLHNERQAVQDAVTVAQTRGVDIAAEAVLRLPADMTLWQASRSEELENAAALALLGPVQREAPGGGVAIYTADKGQMVFRRGGAVELNGLWDQPFDPASCTAALESAGFAAQEAMQEQSGSDIILVQMFEDLPVFNSRLTCRREAGNLLLEGRWMLADEPAAQGSGLTRAQMVLALCDLLEAKQTALQDVQAGYYLFSEDGQSLSLEPVWAAATADGQVLISCITGQPVSF